MHLKFSLSSFATVAISLGFLACADMEGYDDYLTSEYKAKQEEGLRLRSVPFKSGRGYAWYRTPSLIKASNGHLLAFAGARDERGDDSRSDVVLRRSVDGGRTWEPMQTIAGIMKNRNGLPSPVTLKNGKIIVLYMWSKYVTEYKDRGCRKMYKITSTDHGVTWSKRVEITEQTQLPCREDSDGRVISPPAEGEWGWTGLGPVHGIVKRSAPHVGRIVFAARHKDTDGKSYAHVIYSDDDGESWEIGGSLDYKSSEATVVELPNGDIMLNARSTGNDTNRVVGISHDGGETFDAATQDSTLIEPGCQGSLLRYRDSLIFSNPKSRKNKTAGTIRRSTDDGETWQFSRKYLPKGEFSGYSDMVRKNNDIGLLVEWGASKNQPHQEIRYIIIPKEDLGL